MESWGQRSRRIARERNAQARAAGNRGGTWTTQARNATRIQKAKKEEVMGTGSWSSHARKAQKHREQRTHGERKSWWVRLRKEKQ